MTWEKDLHTFLIKHFKPNELWRFCRFCVPTVCPDLNGESISDLAFSLIVVAGRLGLINKPFFDALVAEREGFATEIRALQEMCPTGRDTPPPPPPATPSSSPPRPLADDDVTHAALILNRTDQWKLLSERCANDDRHLIFFVHGDHEQDLDLFLTRIKVFFKNECTRRHNLIAVPRTQEHSTATDGSEWSRRIVAKSPVRASLADALASAARTLDAFYILEDYGHPLKGLTWLDFEALTNLFQMHILAEIEKAPPSRPLRFLVPLQHDPQDALATRRYLKDTTKTLERVMRVKGFDTILVKELTLPTAKDFERFAVDFLSELSKPERAELAALYKELTDRRKHPRQSYRTLGDALQGFVDRTAAARRST